MHSHRFHPVSRYARWAVAAAVACLATVSGAADYDRDYPPPPVNPNIAEVELARAETAYRNAEQRLDRAVRAMHDAEQRARQAAEQLSRANRAVDDYLANQGPSDAGRQAVVAVEEARQDAAAIRDAALKPLKRDILYRRKAKELEDARERFADLEQKRQRADFLGRRMEQRDRDDIVYLADKIFKLETELYARELDVLDDHAAYEAAEERLAEMKKVAHATMGWLRELERSDPKRKAIAESIRKANAAAREADRALDAARQERADSKRTLAGAGQRLAEARRVKEFADRGLATPRRGD